MLYYIICKRHGYRQDHAMLFWGKDFKGYNYDLNKAGLYTEDQLSTFTHPSDDKPIAKDVIDAMVIDAVIDNACLGKIVLNNSTNRSLVGTKVNELHSGPTNWDSRAFCSPEQFMHQSKNTSQILADINNLNKPQPITGAD